MLFRYSSSHSRIVFAHCSPELSSTCRSRGTSPTSALAALAAPQEGASGRTTLARKSTTAFWHLVSSGKRVSTCVGEG